MAILLDQFWNSPDTRASDEETNLLLFGCILQTGYAAKAVESEVFV
jgi:hypothetical protein